VRGVGRKVASNGQAKATESMQSAAVCKRRLLWHEEDGPNKREGRPDVLMESLVHTRIALALITH
jgi:hypothetical protein